MFYKVIGFLYFSLTFVLVLIACTFFVDDRKTFKMLIYSGMFFQLLFYIELVVINFS